MSKFKFVLICALEFISKFLMFDITALYSMETYDLLQGNPVLVGVGCWTGCNGAGGDVAGLNGGGAYGPGEFNVFEGGVIWLKLSS